MGFFDMMSEYQTARRQAAGIYTEEETAQAYRELNQQLENQFQQRQQQAYQKAQAENPDADLNIEDFQIDPLQRWGQQVQALVQSGNPVLRKQGESMMQAYRQRTTPAPKAQELPNAWREYQLAKMEGYEGTFQDWKTMNRASTNIDIQGEKYVKSTDNFFDAQGNRVKVPAGTTYDEVKQMGLYYGQQPTSEEAQQIAATENSQVNIAKLDNLISENEDMGIYSTHGWMTKLRSGSDFMNTVVDNFLDLIGDELTDDEAETVSLTMALSNQLLDAMRGAQVGPAEQEKFERQLPMPGQPEKTFKKNLELTKKNITDINARKKRARGTGPVQPGRAGVPTGPGVRKPGDTWVEGGYEYRITDDGRTQRRRIS